MNESVILRRETFEALMRVAEYCREEIDSKLDWLLFHYPGMKESKYLAADRRNRHYLQKLIEKARSESK